MSTISNQDLVELLTILYQGSVRRNARAVTAVSNVGKNASGVKFFRREDIENVAADYGFPLPASGVDRALAVGLARGVFQRSIEDGTQCGASLCRPTLELPTLVYGYNPSLMTVNSKNVELIAGTTAGTMYNYTKVSGSFVKYQNNRAPCYGTRGSATFDNDFQSRQTSYQSTKCCK